MALDETKSQIVSILICSRDRRKALEALVASLKKMETDYLFQIVVVEETDDPSPINGSAYVSHPVANRGIPYARNLALANAKGEMIVFLDDDCIIFEEWLDRLLLPFADPSVIGVQGGVTMPQSSNAIGWAESILGFPGGGIQRVFQAFGNNEETQEISTLNCAFRKRVIDKVGGFDERLQFGGEDYLFTKRACEYGKGLFVPDAMVAHAGREKLIEVLSWFRRRGRAEIALAKIGWRQKEFFLYWLRSSLFLKLAVLLILGWLFSSPVLVTATVLVIYYLAQLSHHYPIYRNSKAPLLSLVILPIVKLAMDIGVDLGRFRGSIPLRLF